MVHPRHIGSGSVMKTKSSRPVTLPVAKYPATCSSGSGVGVGVGAIAQGCNDCGGGSSGCCESGGGTCGCETAATTTTTKNEAGRGRTLPLALFATAAMAFIAVIRQR